MSPVRPSDGATVPPRDRKTRIVPCLLLRSGLIQVPGKRGPEVARTPDGAPFELFDVCDSLIARFGRIYLVDLDGVEENRPQLDYIQEITREAEVWLDCGSRTADEAIDALVTGASRAVLSTATLAGPEELERAWRLSQELALEVETRGGRVASRSPAWSGRAPTEVAEAARAVGLREIVLGPRDGAIDWEAVRTVAKGGPTWVGGIFEASEADRLGWSGAEGGIFHIESRELITTTEGSPWTSLPRPGAPTQEPED